MNQQRETRRTNTGTDGLNGGRTGEQSTSSYVSSTIDSIGNAISEYLPNSEVFAKSGKAITDSFKTAEGYFKNHDMKAMSEDLTNVVKRNPLPSVWLGVGIGFLLGTTLNRR